MKPSPGICRRLSSFGALGNNQIGLTETALVLAGTERPGIDFTIYERHLEKLKDNFHFVWLSCLVLQYCIHS